MKSKNGELVHVVFESIIERAWGAVLGVPTGIGIALNIIKEWTSEINLLTNNGAAK